MGRRRKGEEKSEDWRVGGKGKRGGERKGEGGGKRMRGAGKGVRKKGEERKGEK